MKRKNIVQMFESYLRLAQRLTFLWKAAHHFVRVCRDVVSLEVVIVINNSIICGITIVKLMRQSSNHHNAEGS